MVLTMLFAQKIPFDISSMTGTVGNLTYLALAAIALWGSYCVLIAWRRIGQLNFKRESQQYDFLAAMHQCYLAGDMEAIRNECQGDKRAVPQLVLIALKNMSLPATKLHDLLIERFQRDVLVEIDYRTTWVHTVIKSAPMLGLFGTVLGMMGAFSKLGAQTRVEPTMLASDIMLALITTAIGLTIAVPLIFATASLSIRTAKLEDYVSSAILNIVEWKK
ncbi:MAG: MotA/TolQ/ExbB proton channel family protein [Planctomycetaceae bacterium]|nr:MotA/TolQ/ExbB proton channel family protein [Planctomycetaceae bacterium]